ncbi:hypothetical protein [Amphibacillus sediminis]|uniref:hypothetical protein n=1 Tax=Amphibacillus sediminis TaxID=360185 RepID=UPI000836AC8C|nr:hypothetical protein [Amphibacillus sediminis]
MFNRIYQQLLILGISDQVFQFGLLLISIFIIFILVKPVVHYLSQKQLETCLTFILTFFIVYYLFNLYLRQSITFNNQLHLYAFSFAAITLTLRLLVKKLFKS